MGSPDILHGHIGVAVVSGPASALVTQLQVELRSLLTRNKELRRHIRSIHAVLSGLQEMASTLAFDHLCLPCEASQPSPADRTIAGRPGRVRRSGSRRKSNHVSVSVQRACRIALMESETAASLEDLYARIVRRGSFSFVNARSANPVLVRVLCAMARDGEVRLLKNGPCWRWERTSGAEIGTSGPFSGTNAMISGL